MRDEETLLLLCNYYNYIKINLDFFFSFSPGKLWNRLELLILTIQKFERFRCSFLEFLDHENPEICYKLKFMKLNFSLQ